MNPYNINPQKQLEMELAELKKIFEEWITNEVEFEKLKPIRARIHALEKAIEVTSASAFNVQSA